MKASDIRDKKQLAAMFDHTYLKPDASEEHMQKLCDEAKAIGAAMVAINSCQVSLCRKLLEGTDIHIGAAISFPLGQTTTQMKVAETLDALERGADEIDYVVNLSDVKNGNWKAVEHERRYIVSLCRDFRAVSKVIFEICYLNDEEIRHLALIAKEIKPDFIKTSTGFGTSGATVEAVKLMKDTVGDDVQVKAAGGIRSWETCKAMIDAGATRIGTSSSLKILEEFEHENMSL